jgi:hypothetical protein
MSEDYTVTIKNACKNCEIKVNGDGNIISPGDTKNELIPLVATIVNPDGKNKKIELTTEVGTHISAPYTIKGISPDHFELKIGPPSSGPPGGENDNVTIEDDEGN